MTMDDNNDQSSDNNVETIDENTMRSVAEIMASAMDEDDEGDMNDVADIAEAVEADMDDAEDVEADDADDNFEEDADADAVSSEEEDEEGAIAADSSDSEDDSDVEVNAPLDTIRILEALLFASPEPLSLNALRERLPENADVGGMLMQLKEEYATRGVHLVDLDGHWVLRTADDLNDALLLKREVRRPLSRAAMETLAIVAYHQPVTRAEIENIRGVVIAKGTLDILMECGWVKPGRRRETPGRPLTWVTTANFLDHFGLETVNELPGLDDLKASGLLDRRPAIENVAPDLFDQIEEADEKAERAARDAEDEDEEGGFETHFDEADAVAVETEQEAAAELNAVIDDIAEDSHTEEADEDKE